MFTKAAVVSTSSLSMTRTAPWNYCSRLDTTKMVMN